mmetsp:Transcript_56461/g.156372  ORF Transcript_56461/g.156372 Transcript_56461/m.156372 type:complete len:218 (-) Transcript_56461:223-876(-)
MPRAGIERHGGVGVGDDLEILGAVGAKCYKSCVQTLDAAIRCHWLPAPCVECPGKFVVATDIVLRPPPSGVQCCAIVVHLDIPTIVMPRAPRGEVHLPILPVIAGHRDGLRRCLSQALRDHRAHVLGGERARCAPAGAPDGCGGVRATEAKGEHAAVRSLPAEDEALGGDDTREAVHVQVRVEVAEVAIRSSLPIDAHEDGLDEAADTGAALAMSDV